MTTRKSTQKAVQAVSALPPTPQAPLVTESSVQRSEWLRQIEDAKAERELIAQQRESLFRINVFHKDEAEKICEARVSSARALKDRAFSDADGLLQTSVGVLDTRDADLEKVIAGLSAAVGASE